MRNLTLLLSKSVSFYYETVSLLQHINSAQQYRIDDIYVRSVFENPTIPKFENLDQERRYNSKAIENFRQVSAHANVVNTYDEFDVVEKRKKTEENNLPSWSALIDGDEEPDEEPRKKFNYVYEEADIEI